jgi:hypothetical protein
MEKQRDKAAKRLQKKLTGKQPQDSDEEAPPPTDVNETTPSIAGE